MNVLSLSNFTRKEDKQLFFRWSTCLSEWQWYDSGWGALPYYQQNQERPTGGQMFRAFCTNSIWTFDMIILLPLFCLFVPQNITIRKKSPVHFLRKIKWEVLSLFLYLCMTDQLLTRSLRAPKASKFTISDLKHIAFSFSKYLSAW